LLVPGVRRLRYSRYADDHLLGFTGPKAEAEEIKQRLAAFLRDDFKLELSHDKTLITHARSGAARFLGYEITVQHDSRRIVRGRRSANAAIGLRVPKDVIKAKCSRYLAKGKPAHRGALIHNDDHTIIATFGAEYRGITQYYLLAGDVHRLHRLEWVMKTSMLKTLAGRHHSTVSKMAARHKAKIETPHGLRTCFEARIERDGRQPLVARFGGIPLKRQKMAVISDRQPLRVSYPHKELIDRLLADTCEICKQTDNIQVHHVRKLADLAEPRQAQPDWVRIMARRRRKSLVVCGSCYERIQGWQTA